MESEEFSEFVQVLVYWLVIGAYTFFKELNKRGRIIIKFHDIEADVDTESPPKRKKVEPSGLTKEYIEIHKQAEAIKWNCPVLPKPYSSSDITEMKQKLEFYSHWYQEFEKSNQFIPPRYQVWPPSHSYSIDQLHELIRLHKSLHKRWLHKRRIIFFLLVGFLPSLIYVLIRFA